MKGKWIVLLAAGFCMAVCFSIASVYAGTEVKDVMEMKNTKAFASHKMGIVTFTHKKHITAKPDGYGIGCGECHHGKDGKPLTLKAGDNVQGCMECHKKPEKPKKEKGVSAADFAKLELEHYYGAMHGNCIDCHKKTGAGPVKCADCHPKKEK